MLLLSNLVVGYPQRILISDISVQVEAGSFIALLGINGIGKSTLLKTISGLQKPISGRVMFTGKNIHTLSPETRSSAVTIAGIERAFVPFMSVREFVHLGRFRFENVFSFHKNVDFTDSIISLLGMQNIAHRPLHAISDGERQKAIIGRALAQNTPLLLLDEPTAFLDYKNKLLVFRLLREIALCEKKTILVSTHDLEEAFQLCVSFWWIDENRKFHVYQSPQILKTLLK
jgi:iron complex transport system ATP-binding protein